MSVSYLGVEGSLGKVAQTNKNLSKYLIIKFPFKRNGLPCCEDEPGSEKIALK